MTLSFGSGNNRLWYHGWNVVAACVLAGIASSALPITSLVPGYGTAKDPLAAAGTARLEGSTQLGGRARLRPALDLRRATLWGVLFLGVVVLGWMAWRLSKQMQSAPPPQGATQPDSKPGLGS